MKPNYKILLSLLTVICVFFSCQNETLVLGDKAFGYDYYPIEVGKYWIYRVDSTVVASTSGQTVLLETTSYVREDITSSFLNPEGDTSYVIQRSVSETQNGTYRSTDIWKVEKTTSNLSRFEENLQFIKLIFPVNIGDTWDGNLFDQRIKVAVAQQNMEPYLEWKYSVDSLKATETIGGTSYENVIKVTQAMYENDIEQRLSYEKYSPGVGMIYREMSILDNVCYEPNFDPEECAKLSHLEKANKGYQLKQTLIEHN